MQQFDLIVIGGGSAGLKAARTAAHAGRKVALAEERELGGECFWAGCVPTKALVRAAQVWQLVRRAGEFGIHADIRHEDFSGAMAYKQKIMQTVAGEGPVDAGLSLLGASYFPTRATFEGPNEVRVGNEGIRGERIVIATGTVPYVPPIPGLAEAGYLTNREALELETLPKHLLILGGGPIGLEFAQVFRRFGANVTLLEQGAQILPKEDTEIAALATEYMREEGIHILTHSRAQQVTLGANGEKRVQVLHGEVMEEIVCDRILVATGRMAAVEGLNIEAASVSYRQKEVSVDRYLRTNQPHILAAGDVGGGYLFTHVASYEGKMAAVNAFADTPQPLNLRVVPRCTYTDPEIASIGLTEQEAWEADYPVAAYSFPFAYLDRAIIFGEPKGLVKIVADARDGQILGAHLIGPEASSLLAEVAVCMQNHLPVSAISATMHAYPSFPEAIEAAALSAPRRETVRG